MAKIAKFFCIWCLEVYVIRPDRCLKCNSQIGVLNKYVEITNG